MKPVSRLLPLLLAALLLPAGCAELTEADRTPQLARVTPSASVAVGVVDERADIVNGRHQDTYEGLNTGVVGIPFVHHLRSGDAMSDHLAAMVASGFKTKGARVQTVKLAAGEPPAKARADLAAVGTDRHVLLVLRQWYLVYGGTSIELNYDVEATVLDRAGRPLATKSFQGEQKSRFSIGDNQFYELEKAHRNRLQAILNDEAIARAL